MDPTLMVVGITFQTAPPAVRERFLLGDILRRQALENLSRAEGIEEVIVLATSNRTEFLLWVSDVTLAGNSVMRLLSSDYGLKLCEWEHFYQLLDEAALLHLFSVTSRLDDTEASEPTESQVRDAWEQAQKLGASGRFLNLVVQKALTVAKRVYAEAALGATGASVQPGPVYKTMLASARKIVQEEAHSFRGELIAEPGVPTMVALRTKLDEICRQELDCFRQQSGPFPKDQDAMLGAIMARMSQRIAGALDHELRELPEKSQREEMTAAVQRLFHLQTSKTAQARTHS